jgi:hypothetical protein
VKGKEASGSLKNGEFLDWLSFSKGALLHLSAFLQLVRKLVLNKN